MVWAGRGLKKIQFHSLPFHQGFAIACVLVLRFLNSFLIFILYLESISKLLLLCWFDFTSPWDRFLDLQGWDGKSWVSLGMNLNIRTGKRDSAWFCCSFPDGRTKSGKKGCVSWDICAFSWNDVGRLS